MNNKSVYRCECSAFATIPGESWAKFTDEDRETLRTSCGVQDGYSAGDKILEVKAVGYFAISGRPENCDDWGDVAREAVRKMNKVLEPIEFPEELYNALGFSSVKVRGEEDPLFEEVTTLDDLARMINESEDYPGDLVAIVCENEGFYNLEGDPAYFVRSSDEIIATDESTDDLGVVVVPYSDGKPVRCSADNGLRFCTPEELIAAHEWETIEDALEFFAREKTHSELAPCSNLEFLRRYLDIAPCDLIIG